MKKGEVYTRHFVVSSDVYNGFINVFQDKNPLHTDDAFAKKLGFPRRVMHGNILNGFLSYFIGECLPVKNVFILTQQIMFTNPVFLNDALTLEVVIDDVHESVNAVDMKFVFSNQDAKKVAKGKIQIGLR